MATRHVLAKIFFIETLLIIDTLHPLCTLPPPFSLATYLSSLLGLSPNLSLVAVYHTDVPLPVPNPPSPQTVPSGAPTPTPSPFSHTSDTLIHSRKRSQTPVASQEPYSPSPLAVLNYLSTTILTTTSLSQTLAKKTARDRSLAEPVFGIEEEKEGILTALCPQPTDTDGSTDGFVLEMEHRRKSGRTGGIAKFYMPSSHSVNARKGGNEKPTVLEDHPFFLPRREDKGIAEEGENGTFELNLTERQKRAREGVVLPYYDAQKDAGGGNEGGRILYDMGIEDDFDEEEDEI